jgi:tRNA pseudouridine13 synthase
MPEARAGARDAESGLNELSTPGVGGRLKTRVSDFIVDEIGGEPREHPNGKYTCAIVRLTNWETNNFVREASERLQMSRKKIHFSGTKDKRGITTRVFTFEAPLESVRALSNVPGIEVQRLYRTNSESSLGDHWGNAFELILRDVQGTKSDVQAAVDAIARDAFAKGGFPNVFGPQRFGAMRATTHLVGAAMVRGDFFGAVHAYLGGPPMHLGSDDEPRWRSAIQARDYPALLPLTGAEQSFERSLLHSLVARPDDPISALRGLPKNLQLLFVSAYQSYIFNRIVSRRIREGLSLNRCEPGDLVAPIEGGLPRDEWVPVTETNRARVDEEIENGRAVLTGLLPGIEVPHASRRPGRIEEAILQEEGITRSNFVVPEHLEWSSKGLRRALLLNPANWQAEAAEDDLHPGRSLVRFRFALPRGTYATSVLREIMKAPSLADYA